MQERKKHMPAAMTSVVVTPDMVRNYGTNSGNLELSAGFFQRFFEVKGQAIIENPILQVVQIRMLPKGSNDENSSNYAARVRLSDGIFSFSACFFPESLTDQLQKDDMKGKDDGGNGGEIIVIKKMRIDTYGSFGGGKKDVSKPVVMIESYQLLSRNHPIYGNPMNHAGDAETMHGFKPTTKIEVDWKEANIDGPSAKRHRPEAPSSCPPAPVRAPSSGGGLHNITPISVITPYVNKWKILGVCTDKEELRTIKGRTGEMKVFNFELTDKDGTTIRLASFADLAEKLYSVVQTATSFYVSGGTVKQANKRFNNTGHDYEITLRNDSEVTQCAEYIPKPVLHLKVCPLDRIVQHRDEMVDVLAVVDKVGPLTEFTSKAGKETTKRELTLVDKTGTQVQHVLWYEQARTVDDHWAGQVIGVKGAQVKEWNGGFSLGGGKLELTPQLPEVPSLYEWYTSDKPNMQLHTISTTTTGGGSFARDAAFIKTATELQMGMNMASGTGVYLNFVAMVTATKSENAIYQACSREGCQKKVVQLNMEYRCEKCQVSSETFKWNYMANMEITDGTGSCWVTLFSTTAAKLFGVEAQTLGELKESDKDAYDAVFANARFKPFNWRIRAKSEVYNEETRIKYSAYNCEPVPWTNYIEQLEQTYNKLLNLKV